MLKRLLGIKKLEKNLKIIGESLNRSWQWINHFNELNQHYEEKLKKIENSQLEIMSILKELLDKLKEKEHTQIEEQEEEIVPQVNPSININNKDLFILRLIHQYAAFDVENSIDTNAIYTHLPFKITQRGLRKKLDSLHEKGFLRCIKRGNTKYWYLSPGAIAKLKKAAKQKE